MDFAAGKDQVCMGQAKDKSTKVMADLLSYPAPEACV
jgi:hypothetical protein